MNMVSALSTVLRCSRWTLGLALAAGCSQRSVTVQLHPLQQSGDVTYVCLTATAAGETGVGVPLSDCNRGSIAREERDLFALVTQTSTGEVAVINVPLDSDEPRAGEGVVDLDPATPGYGFLPIGAQPGDIVTTPGGHATFVGVAEPGKPGLFALPSVCVSSPAEGEIQRDLTIWPACSLPAAPGSIAVLVEPPSEDGTIFTSCDHADPEAPLPPSDPSNPGNQVPACGAAAVNLAAEGGPVGRRKLVVALPDLGKLAVIDAQSVLERPPGSFQPCVIERELLALSVDLPATPASQPLPEDLLQAGECTPFAPPAPPAPTEFVSTPAGFALADDGTLYVADATAPLIHVIDAKNPCALSEKAPLYPRSIENASRVVTTSRVAVSPLTPSAKRFVYAIDQFDLPSASVMAFDVSPGSTDQTPIVRPGTAVLPFEAADRIQFAGAPKDLTFLLRDRPEVDPKTGNVAVGEACDPDPSHTDAEYVGVAYRPSLDYSTGARASELRGVFASVLLTNGQVAIVDVEDFDAPCRRPRWVNPSAEEDFRGCRNDPASAFEVEGLATVTGEVSCRMVQPHRVRSASLGITSTTVGIRAPSLRAFPQLRVPDTAPQLALSDRPKLLAVDFPGVGGTVSVAAEVHVGTTHYSRGNLGTELLVMDPSIAERHSLALPFNEPRAYPGNEERWLTYEGVIAGPLSSGFLEEGMNRAGFDPGAFVLRDSTDGFCDRGVHDIALMQQLGQDQLGLELTVARDFAATHADYVVITSDFPEADSPYWQGDARECSRDSCIDTFGEFDDKEPRETREFNILDAQQQFLSLSPRNGDASLRGQARCCFPSGTSYLIRAADQWVLRGSATDFRHDVVATWAKDAQNRDFIDCTRDCSPRKRYFQSRVFEIKNDAEDGAWCVANAPTGVTLDEDAARCIHATPTARFAVYRGAQRSFPGMSFGWQTIGGFSALRIDLSAVSAAVSPQALVPLPGFNWLSVVDSTSLGLALLSIDSLAPLTPTLN